MGVLLAGFSCLEHLPMIVEVKNGTALSHAAYEIE
jgi:hypothetical protein